MRHPSGLWIAKIAFLFLLNLPFGGATAAEIGGAADGGVSFYSKSPIVSFDVTQWALFDGDTSTAAMQTSNAGTSEFMRAWHQDVTINSITLYKSTFGNGAYEASNGIVLDYRHNGVWQQAYMGDSIYQPSITVNFGGSPITADAIRIAGTAATNKYLYFYDVAVDGSLSSAPVTLQNVGSMVIGGGQIFSSRDPGGTATGADNAELLVDGNTATWANVARQQSDGYVTRLWDQQMSINSILFGLGSSTATASAAGTVEYLAGDGVTWLEYATTLEVASSQNPAASWMGGVDFDSPIVTRGVRISDLAQVTNNYARINELYIYGTPVPEPSSLALCFLAVGALFWLQRGRCMRRLTVPSAITNR